MIVLSFTVCFYGSVLALAYTYRLSWLAARALLRVCLDDQRAHQLTAPWHAPGSWKPDLEQHQFGAALLCGVVSLLLFINLARLTLRRVLRNKRTTSMLSASPRATHPALLVPSQAS